MNSSSDMSAVSFYVRIESLAPNYQAQPPRYGPFNFWSPPTIRTGYTRTSRSFFRWRGGIMTHASAHDHLGQLFSAATVFTQNPDTTHLLVVPFDAQVRNAHENNGGNNGGSDGGWRPLVFRHVRIDNTPYTYSAVSAVGDRQHIAARGSSHWMPQLLPRVYDFQNGSPRLQAGLIGDIPLLIALAAFSAPPNALGAVLTNHVRPGVWCPHPYQYPAGREL